MARYLVLYKSSQTAEQQMADGDPSQREDAMALWNTWFEQARSAIVEMGTPLSEALTIPARADADRTSHIGGYTILEAKGADEARTLLEGHPHFHSPDATIDVLEMLPTPGLP